MKRSQLLPSTIRKSLIGFFVSPEFSVSATLHRGMTIDKNDLSPRFACHVASWDLRDADAGGSSYMRCLSSGKAVASEILRSWCLSSIGGVFLGVV